MKRIFKFIYGFTKKGKKDKEMLAKGLTKCKSCGTWVRAATETNAGQRCVCINCWYSNYIGSELIKTGNVATYGILKGLSSSK